MSSLPQPTPSIGSTGVQPLLVTMEDFQKLIGCGKTTAFAIVARGDVETVQIGRRRMAVFESVQSYVEKLRLATKLAASAHLVLSSDHEGAKQRPSA